jgi:hypothetical protein
MGVGFSSPQVKTGPLRVSGQRSSKYPRKMAAVPSISLNQKKRMVFTYPSSVSLILGKSQAVMIPRRLSVGLPLCVISIASSLLPRWLNS